MIVICPNCNLSKDLGPVIIPSRGAKAACPRCRTLFEIPPDPSASRRARWWKAGAALVIVAGIAAVLLMYDRKLDRNYFLQPGVWQGEQTFMGRKDPFELVIETAQDGKLDGYMDWVGENPRYRLAIRGTYVGNHLVFEDYAFLERVGSTGIHDVQNVYIIGNEMTGTSKNGIATIHALKRESKPF